jgi:signal transduction histidine kinase
VTFLHSRKFGYWAFTLAVLALEFVFAWRISLVYGEILQGQASAWEIWVLKWTIFLAVAVFGFVLATHRHYGVAAIEERVKKGKWGGKLGVFTAVVVIVAHDWGAAIYSVFGHNRAPNLGLVAITIGMCGLVLVPFAVGRMALTMAESLDEEEDEGFARKKRKVEQRQELAALRQGRREPVRAVPPANRRSLWQRGGSQTGGGSDPLAQKQPASS